MRYETTKIVKIIFCILIQLQILWFLGCSNSNQISNNVNAGNDSKQTVSVYKDFTNKPVNLNNEKDKAKFDKQIEELKRNRELWKSQNISNYNFSIKKIAGGMSDDWKLDFKVRENTPVPLEHNGYPELYKYEYVNSFEKIFDFAQKNLEEGSSVSIKYNETFGYPTEVSILFSIAADAFSNMKVEKFEAVN
jgi:hypothetical protein